VYNGWLVHSHTNSYLYWEQCMRELSVSLRFFIAMQELSSLNLMNCTCYVVTSPSILCALWKPDLITLWWTMNSLSHISSYFLVRLMNRNRHGGWILLYIRDDLSYNVTLAMILATWNCHCTMVVSTTFVSVPCTVQLHHSPCFSTAVYFMQKENPFSTWILYLLVF